MGWMSKFTLLKVAVLIIPHGVLKTREFKKRFWAEMAARIHQFINVVCRHGVESGKNCSNGLANGRE